MGLLGMFLHGHGVQSKQPQACSRGKVGGIDMLGLCWYACTVLVCQFGMLEMNTSAICLRGHVVYL